MFLGFGTRVDEGVQVFFGHHVQLISRESCLELLNFWDSARSEVNTSRFMELVSKTGLQRCLMAGNMFVLGIFIMFCFCHDNGTSTAHIVLVFDLDNTVFLSQIGFLVDHITTFSTGALGHFYMDDVHINQPDPTK